MLGVYVLNAASQMIFMDIIENSAPSPGGGALTYPLQSTVKPNPSAEVQEWLKTNPGPHNLWYIGTDGLIHDRDLSDIQGIATVTWTDAEAVNQEMDHNDDAVVAGSGTGR